MSCDDQKYLFRQSQFVFVYQNKSKLILSTWSDQNSKRKEEKKGATSFYFKIKIGYIITFLCLILHHDTKGHTLHLSNICTHKSFELLFHW